MARNAFYVTIGTSLGDGQYGVSSRIGGSDIDTAETSLTTDLGTLSTADASLTTDLATLSTAIGVLVADGATPTQAHVTTANSALTLVNTDATAVAAALTLVNADATALAAGLTARADVAISYNTATVTSLNQLKRAFSEALRMARASGIT